MTANAEASALTTEASAKVLDKLLVLDITGGACVLFDRLGTSGLALGYERPT
jgi:hypothetical protein